MKRTIFAIILAVVIGLPLGVFVAIVLTPVLWKLEPILNMELAGHSGPSDWIFCVIWLVLIPLLFLLFRRLFRKETANARLNFFFPALLLINL
jgi:ABC-type antimicrobial peptide transport system permease subunit